jgi:hypothetical protein
MGQRTDKMVEADARSFNETKRDLERFLRSRGIRNPHTSRKAQAAIARAATMPLSIPAERERGRG